MSRTFHGGERRIRVRGIRRKEPDIRRLGRAIVELALAQAQAELEAEQERKTSLVARRRVRPKREGRA
jgi:hypothetical protein